MLGVIVPQDSRQRQEDLMAGRMEGKVAVVTGAGSGQGRATSILFAREGAKVIAADISGEEKDAAAEGGPNITPVHCDVSEPDDVKAMIDEAVSRHGRLDALCNVAGIALSNNALIADIEVADWDKVLDVNLKGIFLGMKYGLPAIIASGGGTVVNWGSIGGIVASGMVPAYSSSKAGVIHLTRNAAVQYGPHGVRVNCICPGFILTNMFERGAMVVDNPALREQALSVMRAKSVFNREGTAEEIAEAALWLSTPASSFVTGVALPVDGGWSIRGV
jgi:NAD(P)-dependent dehydrogenase (short-subunit alcohol dehydrogenase family)